MNTIELNHKLGAHCETGTIVSLLNHKGMEITEPLVFGISSGIFFGYLDSKQFNFPIFIVRSKPGSIRKNLSKRLGIKFTNYQFNNIEKGEQKLDALIEQNIPTAGQVDFFYMDYLPEWQRVHINLHFIVFIGIKDNKYIISDSYHPQIAELEKDKIRKARFAGGYMAPKGFLFYPNYIPQHIKFEKPVITGIKKACVNMIKLPVPFVGVKGIYRFADRIFDWPDLARDEEDLSHQVVKISIFLEDQGTGGGGFRYMYATFLQQAAQILNHKKLDDFAERMMVIGDKWRNISYFASKIGKTRDLGYNRFKELSEMIRERGDEEKIFFKDLLKEVKSL